MSNTTSTGGQRIVSLDLLRGLAVAGMILVDSPVRGPRSIRRWSMPRGTASQPPTWCSRPSCSAPAWP